MRVAFVGKGGDGKSFTAATFARSLARRGARVLALDIDSMPGLALSLGAARDSEPLPGDLAEERPGEGWVMRETVPALGLVERYAATAPDGVRLLTLGKAPSGWKPASGAVFRHVVRTFDEPGWSVIGDLPAGVRQAAFGWTDFAEIVALVVQPTAASALSARRLVRLLADSHARAGAVVSKWRPGDDARALARSVGLPLLGIVPYDDAVRRAEAAGDAPIDAVPNTPAVRAVQDLVVSMGGGR